MAKTTKPAAARTATDPVVAAEPSSAGKAVGYSREEAALPAVACADTSMGGYQDLSGSEDRIRALAYSLWKKAGNPNGRDAEFWEQAERQVGSGREDRKPV